MAKHWKEKKVDWHGNRRMAERHCRILDRVGSWDRCGYPLVKTAHGTKWIRRAVARTPSDPS